MTSFDEKPWSAPRWGVDSFLGEGCPGVIGAEARSAEAGVPGTDVEIGGVNPVLEP